MKFYMAQIENCTQCKCILKQYINVGKVKYCKKNKKQNGIHDKHVINYGKSDLL